MWHSLKRWLARLLEELASRSSRRPAPSVEIRQSGELRQPLRAEGPAPSRSDDAPINLHLGIDFGTRFTKVCFRDLGRDRSEIVTFSPLITADLAEALLPSRLEIRDGMIHGGLTESEWKRRGEDGTAAIEFLKIRLAHLDIKEMGGDWPLAAVEGLSDPEGVEALAAFYLAKVIDRSRTWIGRERRDLLVGRRPLWSISLGVPVQYCDSPALGGFEKVLRLAAAWAGAGVEASIGTRDLRSVAQSFCGSEPELDCHVVPELGAAVRSFIASPQAPEGVYVYLDVGSGTLDGVSFRYLRQEGRTRLVCHSASVQPLGVSAVAARVGPLVDVPPEEIERLLSGGDRSNPLAGQALDESRQQIRRLVAGILLEGKRKDRMGWSEGVAQVGRKFYQRSSAAGGKFPLFVGGGGSLSRFYRKTIASTYTWNQLDRVNVRQYVLEQVPVPRDLDMHGLPREQFHRFAVAYGLSIPPGESGHLDLPSTVPPEKPRQPRPPKVRPYENTKEIT